MTTYEPGTIALATVRGVENVRVMAGYGTAEPRLRWVTTDSRLVDVDNDGWWFSYQATDVRPLVVLDLAGWDTAELIGDLRGGGRAAIGFIADQIEQQTRQPKPVEPTGLGAVVEDSKGVLWVRDTQGHGCAWKAVAGDRQPKVGYRASAFVGIDVVRVLSEGWSE